jgi:hypothetical protein
VVPLFDSYVDCEVGFVMDYKVENVVDYKVDYEMD